MRRLLVPVSLLLLASCGPSLKGPARTDALEQISGASGLDIVSARQTALDFVQAYAHANDDGGVALLSVVDGPRLRAWAHWLGIQNGAFPGTLAATADVTSLRFVGSANMAGLPSAQVDLGASLTFDYHPQGADPFAVTRRLDGPVTLLRVGEGDWRVIDATRDGQPMDAAIQLLKNVEQTQKGVTVTVDSVFTFAPRWQFNVIVHNSSSAPIALDAAATAIYVKQPGGSYKPTRKTAITPSLATIAPGATVEGLVSVPSQPSPSNRILEMPFALGGRLLQFEFALAGVVNPAQGPLPTATAAAAGASS